MKHPSDAYWIVAFALSMGACGYAAGALMAHKDNDDAPPAVPTLSDPSGKTWRCYVVEDE